MKIRFKLLKMLLILAVFLSPVWAGDHGEGHVCFYSIDADRDEVVSFKEFSAVFGDDKKIFDAMDQDKDGSLTHDEYEAYQNAKE
jgi:hypothetical protein